MSPILIFLITSLAGIIFYFWICNYKQQKYLNRICQGLTGTFHQTMNIWQQLFESRGCYRFMGLCYQRPLTIGYFYRWRKAWDVQTDVAPDERLEISFLLVQKFWLRMILDPDHSEQAEEVFVGNPALDSLYVIHSNQQQAAREFLTSQAALHDLQRLPFPFDRLEIHKGWGKAVFYFPARRHFDQMHLQIAIEALARLFTDYENLSKLVILISVSSDKRCPYCREVFADSAGQIVQCVQCNARLHLSCWNENKQCTTWGCQSTTFNDRVVTE